MMTRVMVSLSCTLLLSACAGVDRRTAGPHETSPAPAAAAIAAAEAEEAEEAEEQEEAASDEPSQYLAFREKHRAAKAAPAAPADPLAPAALDDTPEGVLDLHFIDVGQGDATLIGCPNGNTILVDIGSKGGGNPDAIRDYIWEQLGPDEPHLNTLVITHADGDHFNLIPFVMDGVEVDKVVRVGEYSHFSNVGMMEGYDIQKWLKSKKAVTEKPTSTEFNEPGFPSQRFDCGDAEIYLLAADTRDTSDWWKNTRSIVLKVTFGHFDALLTGDATFITEDAILERFEPSDLQVEVLKVGHHGSRTTSTSDAWAQAVQPQVAVASAGPKNAFGHPSREVVQRLEPYLRTWLAHPMVSGSGKKGNYTWHTSNAYKKAMFNTAAAGTVVVSALSDGSYDIYQFEYE